MLTWLRCFDAAARHLSFQQAAAELSITPGAVSQQIKQLEECLGCVLFERERNAIVLTLYGLRLAPDVTESYATLRQAIARFEEARTKPRISISCSPSFALQWLTPRISRFVARHPGTELSVFGELVRLSDEKMRLCGINFAIRYGSDEKTGPARIFLDEYLVPVASPEFLAATPAATDLGRIDARHLLHDNAPWGDASGYDEWAYWLHAVGRPPMDLSGGSRFNMSQMALATAMTGEGIAIGRLALVYNDLQAGRLVPVFGKAVRASASYQLSAMNSDRQARIVFDWLIEESQLFLEQRAETLSGMVLIEDGP